MKCPQCDRELPEVEGRRYCPFCGAETDSEAAANGEFRAENSAEGATAEDYAATWPPRTDTESSAHEYYCPWEDQENIGFLQGLTNTLKATLFDPQSFFDKVPRTGGYLNPLFFALIVQTLATLFSILWAFQSENPMMGSMDLSGAKSILFVIFMPAMLLASIFLWAGLLHGSLILVGAAQRGFEATFRAACYSYGPELLTAIPLVGGIIGLGWRIGLTVVAMKTLHEISMPKAVMAMMLPLFVGCGLALLALSIMFQGIGM